MPFDPDYPPTNAPLLSEPMRNNFNGLNDKIDAIPAGPPGPIGPPGLPGPANWFQSETDPGGSDGDCWLRPSDGAVFRKESGAWTQFGSIRGPEGPQGPAGEVSLSQLTDAIATTANNPTGIGPWGGSFSDPPTQAEMNDFAGWAESQRAALVR